MRTCTFRKNTLLQPDIPGLWEPKVEQKLAKQIKRSKMEQVCVVYIYCN